MNNPPKRSRSAAGPPNQQVVALVYDGLCSFEFGIAVEMLGLARPELPRWYDFSLCAVDQGLMRAAGGMMVAAEGGLEQLQTAGTIIVPGWRSIDAIPPAPLLQVLRKAHARGARLLPYCSGVFVLAASGLLDGLRATTHWRYVDVLARHYPRICVEPDVLYVDQGRLLTSAGRAAALDLSLHLIRRDYGPEVAKSMARRAVVPAYRDGGQAQFIASPIPAQGDGLGRLLSWMRRHMDKPLSVSVLAERAHMSERTLLRRFEETTGCSPKQWLTHERLGRARELLEGSDMSVERVAQACGFGSADTLRHHFRQQLRVSPARYRERFRTAQTA